MTTYVRTDWIPQNEYTTPIRETPVYCNSGIIKLLQKRKRKFRLERLDMKSLKMKNFNILFLHFGRSLIHCLLKCFREFQESIWG